MEHCFFVEYDVLTVFAELVFQTGSFIEVGNAAVFTNRLLENLIVVVSSRQEFVALYISFLSADPKHHFVFAAHINLNRFVLRYLAVRRDRLLIVRHRVPVESVNHLGVLQPSLEVLHLSLELGG